jgi:hypothetical protein
MQLQPSRLRRVISEAFYFPFVFGQPGVIAGLRRNCSPNTENFGMNFARGAERTTQSLMRKPAL